jgi:hypothetical protein
MEDALVFALRAEVRALIGSGPGAVWQEGIVTGRTLEERPRYDVRLADGSIIWNLPAEYLKDRKCSQRAQAEINGASAGNLILATALNDAS